MFDLGVLIGRTDAREPVAQRVFYAIHPMRPQRELSVHAVAWANTDSFAGQAPLTGCDV
jgi:hypothetical protein